MVGKEEDGRRRMKKEEKRPGKTLRHDWDEPTISVYRAERSIRTLTKN